MNLSIDGGMPLSWREEGPKGPAGYRIKSILVGRRVWGALIGRAMYSIESVDDGAALALRDLRDGGRLIQRWPCHEGYDSPWGGEGATRLRMVAEWHEEREFNASLGLLPDPEDASLCPQCLEDGRIDTHTQLREESRP